MIFRNSNTYPLPLLPYRGLFFQSHTLFQTFICINPIDALEFSTPIYIHYIDKNGNSFLSKEKKGTGTSKPVQIDINEKE
jgi:hypothetical protein